MTKEKKMVEKEKDLEAMRHSAAHVLASAVQKMWPKAKFGVGPVVENGFYYDVDLDKDTLSEEDFGRLEAEMRRIIEEDQPFERFELPIDKAIDWARETGQPYKEELLHDLKRAGTTAARDLDANELGLKGGGDSKVSSVSFYKNGDFVDLCRGPHVGSTGKIGPFKLMRISGAYWRGDEKKPQMQRVYGVAFKDEKTLTEYLELLKEAKKRDHRKLGQELDLYAISELVGSGLPMFTPRGTVLREQLGNFSLELQHRYGFEQVWTPHMAREELYKVSGHFDKYPERFSVTSEETDDTFMMKPMNCPHHVQLFARKPWSYRELPARYMENTTNYRDEKSGELHGLSRVRSLSQDDGHIFCREDQIASEMIAVVEMVKDLYLTLGMDFYARLSYRDDSDIYLGDRRLWEQAEDIIETVARQQGLKSVSMHGEAAFYGPKIDFMVRDSLGREWQCATVQLDFVQPERFKLEYTDQDGQKKRPVMIHKALLGSIERFLSVYIEHTGGRFPVWLAPEQIRVVTVNQEKKTVQFANQVYEKARELGLRITVDNDNESVGKKIRAAEVFKVPYVVVVGEKEVETGKVVPRIRKDLEVQQKHATHTVEGFLKTVANETKARIIKTSL